MQKTVLVAAFACAASLSLTCLQQAFAEEKTISADAQVIQICDVQKRNERLERSPVEGEDKGSKYFVSTPTATRSKCSMIGKGGLLEIPGFGWLKATDFTTKASASSRQGASRILFNNPAGVNRDKEGRYLTLTRETKFDAKTGLLTKDFRESWRVHLIDVSDDIDKQTGYQTYRIDPIDSQRIIDAYRLDIENATANIVQNNVQAACGEMCKIEFQSAEVTGLNPKDGIVVRVIPDQEIKNQKYAQIEWPAYQLKAKFIVHAKTAADMRADFGKKAGK